MVRNPFRDRAPRRDHDHRGLDATERAELYRLLRALMRTFPRDAHGTERPPAEAGSVAAELESAARA